MHALRQHAGSWIGINSFRLTPNDEPEVAASLAVVSVAAAGLLTQIAYTWSHAADGEQSGLLVLGGGEEPGAVVALWCDTWHQPAARSLAGGEADGVVHLAYTYAGDWQWVIEVDATSADVLRVRMDNVIPESAAVQGYPPGSYWAMSSELRRKP
jgi:hypothetical protein